MVLAASAHLCSDELRKWLGIEAAVAEPEAAVHGVGCQLESLLPDVQLLLPFRIALPLDQILDLAPSLHQRANNLQQGIRPPSLQPEP